MTTKKHGGTSSARVASLVAAALGVAGFMLAASEPPEGPGSWITSLAGDWTVRLTDEYVVGNATEKDGTFTVFRILRIQDSNGIERESHRADVKGVLECAAEGHYVLLRTRQGHFWRGPGHPESSNEWLPWSEDSTVVPPAISTLASKLSPPVPSRRTAYLAFGGLMVVGAVILLVLSYRSKAAT